MEENNPPKQENKPSSPKPDNNTANRNLLGVGMQIVGQVVVGVLIGMWLDRHFHTTNSLYTIILSVLMIIVALYQLIRQSFKS
jgi:F0F1-type ATP synthase assembly protein I